MKKNVWTAFLLVIGFAGFAAAQDAGDLPKVLRATVSAYEQLLSESELAATGQYEVKVLDTHKPIQRFRDIYFSQKKKRPIIDDQASTLSMPGWWGTGQVTLRGKGFLSAKAAI
ncbi:hypothetical protein [Verrucomicrobium spinosum]|uniref:hypothetical protein n=1 Tax=Verrucomicrobium spinosum TaxID=2736 RepID=UPI0009464477|nr:hypothetical protein [Verrucomicrobium spinosum]